MIGILGKKAGMTQVYDEIGTLIPVTVIQVEPNVVVAKRDQKTNGYNALLLGFGNIKAKNVSKPYAGQFKGNEPLSNLVEIRDYSEEKEVGDTITLESIESLRYVDVKGISKGKGFQGVMKRHNFGGGRATHGSKFHRANGSTGQAAFPARVMKGTKMAGRMGGEKVTVQNLRVIKVDVDEGYLLVEGAVPGVKDSVLLVKQAKKRI